MLTDLKRYADILAGFVKKIRFLILISYLVISARETLFSVLTTVLNGVCSVEGVLKGAITTARTENVKDCKRSNSSCCIHVTVFTCSRTKQTPCRIHKFFSTCFFNSGIRHKTVCCDTSWIKHFISYWRNLWLFRNPSLSILTDWVYILPMR